MGPYSGLQNEFGELTLHFDFKTYKKVVDGTFTWIKDSSEESVNEDKKSALEEFKLGIIKN